MSEDTDTDVVDRVRQVLEQNHSDRVFTVENGTVWVSGMNSHCVSVANNMAKTLSRNGISAGLVYDDDAVRFGGVMFNFGDAA